MRSASLVLLLTCGLAAAHSSGPPDGKTGRPGEGTCADCHSGTGSGDSTLLSGLPAGTYAADSSYTLTLLVSYAGQTRWGFELTAVDSAGNAAGTLFLVDSTNTQQSDSGGRRYLKQTTIGTQRGHSNGTWDLGWQAPPAGTGPVTFYWCANAANNNGLPSGDFALCSSLTVSEAAGLQERGGPERYHWYYTSPSRHRVVIRYEGDARRPVRVYSSAGALVRTLAPQDEGGNLRVEWDGRDESGRLVPEAAYFVRLGEEVERVVKVELVR